MKKSLSAVALAVLLLLSLPLAALAGAVPPPVGYVPLAVPDLTVQGGVVLRDGGVLLTGEEGIGEGYYRLFGSYPTDQGAINMKRTEIAPHAYVAVFAPDGGLRWLRGLPASDNAGPLNVLGQLPDGSILLYYRLPAPDPETYSPPIYLRISASGDWLPLPDSMPLPQNTMDILTLPTGVLITSYQITFGQSSAPTYTFYGPDLTPQWQRAMHDLPDMFPLAAATCADGSLLLACAYSPPGAATYDDAGIATGSRILGAACKLTPDGGVLWAFRDPDETYGIADAIAPLPDGGAAVSCYRFDDDELRHTTLLRLSPDGAPTASADLTTYGVLGGVVQGLAPLRDGFVLHVAMSLPFLTSAEGRDTRLLYADANGALRATLPVPYTYDYTFNPQALLLPPATPGAPPYFVGMLPPSTTHPPHPYIWPIDF